MIHTLDAVRVTQMPSDGSPFIYYQQSNMLAHAGRLYHLTKSSVHVLNLDAHYKAALYTYVDIDIGISARRIFLVKYDTVYGLTDNFTYKNYVKSGTSDRIVYVMDAVRRLQRFWRSCRLMRKCEVLLLHALYKSQEPTWLQCLPVDILLLIRNEAMAFANY